MKTLFFSIALLLGTLINLNAQDIYLPVSSKSATAKEAYFKALQAGEQGSFSGFFDGMKASIQADPNFLMAYTDLIFVETAFGQYEKAATYIQSALSIDPASFNESENIFRKALIALGKDSKADPAEYMKELTLAYPNTAEAFDIASRASAWISGDPQMSNQYMLQALKLRPNYGAGYNTLGYNYMALQDMSKAKAAFEKYLDLAPDEANAHDSMGEYYKTAGEYAKSIEYYERAVELGMENSQARAEAARAAWKGNVAVVDGMYKSFAQGDVPAVLAALDENVIWNEADNFPYADQNPYVGPDAVLNGVFARIGAEWEYWKLNNIQLHDMANDMVLATLRYDAKHKASGKVIDAQTAHLWTLRNGKVTAFQQFTDTKQLAEAVK